VEAEYLLSLSTGLLGGFGHCIGMCGPVVASYAFGGNVNRDGLPARLMPHLLYNAGRITTYSLVGGLMGLTGAFLNVAGQLAGLQNAVAVLAGIIMIILGLNILALFGSTRWIEKHNFPVLRVAKQAVSSISPLRFLLLGLVLGLLPCGLSYTVFIAAAGTGGFFPGMMTALLFGLGTLPAVFLFGFMVSRLGAVLRGRLYKAGGIIVVIMGVYFLLRGIGFYGSV
jgi:sulfite exporter TauE/SafE